MRTREKNEQIERLEAQRNELERRLKALKVQQRREEKKQEARRRFLIGDSVTQAVEAGELDATFVAQLLDKYVRKERDRVFLELPVEEGKEASG